MTDSLTTLLSIIVLLGGPLMTGFCLYEVLKTLRLVTRGHVTQGEITAIRWSRTSPRSLVAYPTVEFVSTHGKRVVHASNIGIFPAPGGIGTPIRMRYLPDQPSICAIDDFSHLWLGPIILGVMGITLLAYGISVLNRCTLQNLLVCIGA